MALKDVLENYFEKAMKEKKTTTNYT